MHFDDSVDRSELEKFRKDYNIWWDKTGEFSLLHEINDLRVEYIKSKINKYFSNIENLSDIKLLDVGCGGGLVSVPLAGYGVDVTAIDVNAESIESLKENVKNFNNLRFFCSTISDHLRKNLKYDIVICLEVIEHISDISNFINSLTELIKKDGIIIISTINRTLKSYIYAILMAEYVLKLIKKKTHKYDKFVKPSELNNYLKNSNFKINELDGMKFNIYTRKWELSRDASVNYFATCLARNYTARISKTLILK